MVRRAFSGFLPALLALAFLCGTPGPSLGGPEASATSRDMVAATAPIARGGLTQDIPDGAVNRRADQDDNPDDRIVRLATTVIWPDSALAPRFLCASDRAGASHPFCATPPRAPPAA